MIEEEQDAEIDEKKKKKLPALFVYGDIECLIEGNATKLLVADLIRYAIQGEDNVSYACSGPECIPYFISALNKLNEVDENLQRDLFVVFHNLKGFDGNYITEELYKQGMKVENQLRTGAKTLKFDYFYQDAKISFKDSLCIMPTALSELPGMFNFEELHKGWFPHAFHAGENLSYKSRLFSTASHDA